MLDEGPDVTVPGLSSDPSDAGTVRGRGRRVGRPQGLTTDPSSPSPAATARSFTIRLTVRTPIGSRVARPVWWMRVNAGPGPLGLITSQAATAPTGSVNRCRPATTPTI